MDRQCFEELEKLSNSVNNFSLEKWRLIEDYNAGLLRRYAQYLNTSNCPALKSSVPNETIVSSRSMVAKGNKTYVSDESITTSSRGGRRAALLASIKVKKNLNIPVKLRQPSTGSVYEGILRDQENTIPITDVTNSQLNSRPVRTKVIRKCKRSEVPHLPDITSQNNDIENQPVSGTPDRSENSVLNKPKSGPLSIVKMRTKQFENLASSKQKSTQRSLFGKSAGSFNSIDLSKPTNMNIEPSVKEENGNISLSCPVPQEVTATNSITNYKEISQPSTSTLPVSVVLVKNILVQGDESNKEGNVKLSQETAQSPIQENNNITYVAVPSTKFQSPAIPARVTRAMMRSIKIKQSTSESSSNENTSSSSGRSTRRAVKRSLVTLKCKKISIKNGKLIKNNKKSNLGTKNKNDRMMKVRAAREAQMREQHAAEVQALKKKQEKMKMLAAEKERIQKEEDAKKAAAAKQKRLEIEERRKREEDARLARLEELEQERKRADAVFKKKKEEAEAMRLKKLAQDSKPVACKLNLQETAENSKQKTPNNNKTKAKNTNITHTINNESDYEMTPDRKNRVLRSPKTNQDYGIDEAGSGDSSEDEYHPKKRIPSWAERKNRTMPITIVSYIPLETWNHLYKCDSNPQINELVGANNSKRLRTSSAMWTSSPL